jgi:hypothetical protein
MSPMQPALFKGIVDRPVEGPRVRETGTLRDEKGRTRRHKPWWMLLGAGPADQTCASCTFLRRNGHEGEYFKCGRQLITNGPGTDIRKKDPACRLFVPVALDKPAAAE